MPRLRAGLNSHQQRLCLGDLGHLRRRPETFEGRREDGVRVGGASGRMVKFRQREGRLQTKAAGPLLLRYGDGGLEGILGGDGIARVALQQDVTAKTMRKREIPAVFGLICLRQGFVDTVQSVLRLRRLCLEFAQAAPRRTSC